MQTNTYAIEMVDIVKRFGAFTALDHMNLQVRKGEIHAILGENGAGKSTLMSVLFGLYTPEEGVVKVSGVPVKISSPNIATKLKIGMVHQHFKLVEEFTVTENIVLGSEPTKGLTLNLNEASKKIAELSKLYGLDVDPNAKIKDITVGMQQRVEILKMLYKDADILIFDEPSAVLTPQEIEELLKIMDSLRKQNKSLIVITHKLSEIKAVADRCTVIRRGKYIDTVDVKDTDENKMAELMVGRKVSFETEKKEAVLRDKILRIKNLKVKDSRGIETLKGVNFEVRGGEILGVAGIDGNGQKELVEAITGLAKVSHGEVILDGSEIHHLSIRQRTERGIGHIPEDRHKHGLVLDFNIRENMILQTYYKKPYSQSGFINETVSTKFAEEMVEKFDVRSGNGIQSIARGMSGGNQQKAIIAREIAREPRLLIAMQPTRGLDVGAIEFIHKQLIEERDKGNAVLLISFELEEIMNLSDRIAVMYDGNVIDIIDRKDASRNQLGLLMAGVKEGAKNE